MLFLKIKKNDIQDTLNNISYSNKELLLDTNSEIVIDKNPSISFLIIVKDEERCIERFIKTIISLYEKSVDELIIIDTGSVDNTKKIIGKYLCESIKMYEYQWRNSFAEARNFALEKANKEWVFFIDADEILNIRSTQELKKYLIILEDNLTGELFINPTIKNTNDHIIQGVTRIFKNNKMVNYKGKIHEYPFVKNSDPYVISFENILIEHDGYDDNVINMEEKYKRNTKLLNEMIEEEPQNIRWRYFYCRDGKNYMKEDDYEEGLLYIINNMSSLKSNDYYFSAVRDIVEFYIYSERISEAQSYLSLLKNIHINSDVIYFENLIKLMELKRNSLKILQEIMEYRKTRTQLDYGSLHSNYYHIDYLISQLMIDVGNYKSGLNLQKKLYHKGVFDFSIDIKSLYEITKSVMDENHE